MRQIVAGINRIPEKKKLNPEKYGSLRLKVRQLVLKGAVSSLEQAVGIDKQSNVRIALCYRLISLSLKLLR